MSDSPNLWNREAASVGDASGSIFGNRRVCMGCDHFGVAGAVRGLRVGSNQVVEPMPRIRPVNPRAFDLVLPFQCEERGIQAPTRHARPLEKLKG